MRSKELEVEGVTVSIYRAKISRRITVDIDGPDCEGDLIGLGVPDIVVRINNEVIYGAGNEQ